MDSTLIASVTPLFITLIMLIIFKGISGATFTLKNKCDYTVWPGILGNAQLDSSGFELPSGDSHTFQTPPSWSGRFWGRTGCSSDPNTGQFTCTTADCGSSQMECNGKAASPPATLAEFTVGSVTQDFYDVSLVDGYNLPMMVEPRGGSGSCQSTGCVRDLNRQCPNELRFGSGEACRSACEAFGSDEYCCSGAYGSPDTCKPSVYSEMFKAACPRSYSYAFDDATSTYTCTGADYTITFCPSSTSQKSASSTGTSPSITDSESGESPLAGITAWLPRFLTGESTRTLTAVSFLHTTFFASISFLLLHFFYLLI